MWKPNTTIVEAIKDSWSRNLQLGQLQAELLEQYGAWIPINLLNEMYRLYELQMDYDMKEMADYD